MNTTVDQLYPDIWEHVFEYFSANELFFTFKNITMAADDVLMNNKSRLLFRGLVVDDLVHTLPEELRLNQVSSLELHQTSFLDVIEHYTALRSLLAKVSNAQIKIEQLILIPPGIGSLDRIFESIGSISSLFRLEIYANELEEKIPMSISMIKQTNIQRFTLHSCSSISWNDLSYTLPYLSNIYFLDITLFQENKTRFSSFAFPELRFMCLRLHELSFESILALLTTAPLLKKLKLNGLVDDEGFVVNYKWISLFNVCSSLDVVIVNLTFDENTYLFRKETQTALNQINLNLRCFDDGDDYFVTGEHQQRWWKLSGIIMKYHAL